ncbi:MAG: SDR family oxidoreductase [Anaerolineales bacterium]|nr:SDR family oxidoreductase [Anaerolineales bacterium]
MNLQELTKMYDFTGKTVVITGGAGILGGEIACALVGCNANVAILDRDPSLANRFIKRLESPVGRAIVVYADVLDVNILQKSAETVIKEFGTVDCLINAAGGNKKEATTSQELSFFDLPADALRFVFDLNIVGTILPSQVFGKIFAHKGEGNILNISSMSAFRPLTRIPGYSTAKAGVSNFTQWLAVHLAQEYSPKIRVNAIAPGFFLTDQNRFLLTDEKTGELTARGSAILAHTPMGRFGVSDDLLGAVLWLLSPTSAFVTGVVVPIDGGFSAFSGV